VSDAELILIYCGKKAAALNELTMYHKDRKSIRLDGTTRYDIIFSLNDRQNIWTAK
jgi:hypothetical protein